MKLKDLARNDIDTLMKYFTNDEYEIVDGVVNVDGNVLIHNKYTAIPFQFGHVTGTFRLGIGMRSLVGSPREVGKNFYCNSTAIKTLDGAPRDVGDLFNCNNTAITSLKGAPREVGSFSCSMTRIQTLEGGPIMVEKVFSCNGCYRLTSLKGAPREVGGNFNIAGVFQKQPDTSHIEIKGDVNWR